MEDILKKEVVYKINNMEKVDTLKDVVYNSNKNEKFLMDMYYNSKEKAPVVVLVHGEAKGVNFKEAGQYTSLGKLVAVTGLKAVTFNHRVLSEGYTIEEINNDIGQLLKFLIKNANKFNIDENKIAIWCFSGGVPFGLYAGVESFSSNVKCIAAYYGIYDLKIVKQLLNIDFDIKDDEIKKYSPIEFINKNLWKVPPLLIARAGLDDTSLNNSADKFITKALNNNLVIDVYNHPTGEHAFDLFNDNDRTCEIIAKTLEFLSKHLKEN